MSTLLDAVILMVPLVVGSLVHMIVVRFDLLSRLRIPVNGPLFGPNKTWRGFVVMPLATIPGVALAAAIWPSHFEGANFAVLGLLLGLGYALAELPNSWFKRRLGVAPGKRPDRHRLLFTFVDQADSVAGCAVAYLVLLQVPALTLGVAVILAPAVHLVFNFVFYLMGLRKEPI